MKGGVWRIGKKDYKKIKDEKMEDKEEERKALHKKLRGLASPEEKTK